MSKKDKSRYEEYLECVRLAKEGGKNPRSCLSMRMKVVKFAKDLSALYHDRNSKKTNEQAYVQVNRRQEKDEK